MSETSESEFKGNPMLVLKATPEERKTFVRAFVPGITLHPHEARGVVRIRRIPLPPAGDSGNSSFKFRARARYEVEKKISDREEIDELLRLVFQAERAALVPG